MIVETTVAPYGSWRSPFPIELLVAGKVGLLESQFDTDGQSIVWLESRPEEDGRQVLVRWTPGAKGDGKSGGTARDISPAGMNVRDRVHEYGGASYLVAGDLVLVSDFVTGRLHRVAGDRTSEPITPEGAFRYADYELDEPRARLIAVREDHSASGEAVNTLVSIPLGGSGDVEVLAQGRTFYSSPRLSPDGTRLAFLAWDHPNLPWDGTELFVAPVAADGSLGRPEHVAGSTADWIAQPVWSPSGVLHFVAEPDGWMNLQRVGERGVEPVTRLEAESASATMRSRRTGRSSRSAAATAPTACIASRRTVWRPRSTCRSRRWAISTSPAIGRCSWLPGRGASTRSSCSTRAPGATKPSAARRRPWSRRTRSPSPSRSSSRRPAD
jgi:hypothetical protein